ncbi:MAG: folate-binding protein [Pseudomonadota bacterium]
MTDISASPNRSVIRIAGEEYRTFLQGLTTQDVDRLKPDAPIFSCLLTPQGKILFDFFLIETDNAFLIDCDAEVAPTLIKKLTMYKLRAKVEISLEEDLKAVTAPTPIDGQALAAYADPRDEALGWRAIVANADGGENVAETDETYHSRRIAAGVPEFGADFQSDETFLMDVNYDALNGVSYKKGCFVGQEVTSRMKRKGDPRRRTLLIIADDEAQSLEKGATVTADGSTLGALSSANGAKALAVIRLDRWEKAKSSGAEILCGDCSVRIEVPDYLETA